MLPDIICGKGMSTNNLCDLTEVKGAGLAGSVVQLKNYKRHRDPTRSAPSTTGKSKRLLRITGNEWSSF